MTDADDDWQETYEHERGERRACLVASDPIIIRRPLGLVVTVCGGKRHLRPSCGRQLVDLVGSGGIRPVVRQPASVR